MEVLETVKKHSNRGRKPTGKKTRTLGVSLPTWLVDRLKKDAEEKETGEKSNVFTPTRYIRSLLIDHYRSKDQLTMFNEKEGN